MHRYIATEIYTPDGVTRKNLFPGKAVLHLGCGNSKLNGAIGVDRLRLPAVNVVHDLDSFPWPFENESVDVFLAHSVLEHVDSVPNFFEEVWRIGKNGARVIINVPYFRCVDAYVDSTHKHFFASRSLDYFLDLSENSRSQYGYTQHKFTKIGFWYGWPQPSRNMFVRMCKDYIQKHPSFYDQYLSLIIPVKILVWELEIKKE